MAEDTTQPRRIVELDVDEVSNVDNPANLREWLVTKNQRENQMDEAQLAEQAVEKMLAAAGFDFVEKQMPPDLKAAMKLVLPWLQKSAAQADEPLKAAIMQVRAFLTKIEAGRYPSPTPQQSSKAKADMSDEEKKKAEEDKKKAEAAKKEKTEKARRLTQSRETAMSDGLVKMLAAFKSTASAEAFKTLMATIKELPDDLNFTSGVRPTGPTSKSVDPEVLELLKGMKEELTATAKSLADNTARLAKIEETRAASQQPPNDGQTAPAKKSLFANIV